MSNTHHIIISIGCNTNYQIQMDAAKQWLTEQFPDAKVSEYIISPAYGKASDAAPYANALCKATTVLDINELNNLLKHGESVLGDNRCNRQNDIVAMDFDLLEYDSIRLRNEDWKRPYNLKLMKILERMVVIFIFALLAFTTTCSVAQPQKKSYKPKITQNITSKDNKNSITEEQKKADRLLLSKAIDYFHGAKYHEAIVAFEKLQTRYNLNPRYKAYLGLSYFKEQDYENAASCLSEGIENLAPYSPQEQAVYLYSCAESFFYSYKYEEAIKYYKMVISLVESKEKGDVFYHTAFSYYMLGQQDQALPLFKEAINYYKGEQLDELHLARSRQAKKMLKGIEECITQDTAHTAPPMRPQAD